MMTPKYSILTHRICRPRVRTPHGGGGRIRTYEGVSRQIYSLLPLAAWVPLREKRAAYSDFRYRACQCRFRANSPFFPAAAVSSHRLPRPIERYYGPYRPVLIESARLNGPLRPLRHAPAPP